MLSYAKNMARHFLLKDFKKVLSRFANYKISLIFIIPAIIIIILLGILAFYLITNNGKIYPNLNVAGIYVGRNNLTDSTAKLDSRIVTPEYLTLTYQDQSFKINLVDIDLSYNFAASSQKAYDYTRTGHFFIDLTKRVDLIFRPQNLGLVINFNNEKLTKLISVISGQISTNPIEPSVKLVDGEVVVNVGTAGKELNQKELKEKIEYTLKYNSISNIEIPVDVIDSSLSPMESENLQIRAQKFVSKKLIMKFEFNTFTLSDSDILKIIDPRSGYNEEKIQEFIEKTKTSIEREPQNPKFNFEGGKVTEFQPALDGIKLENETFKKQLIESLNVIAETSDKSISFDIPVTKTPPGVTTNEVNDLGIKELIGRGTSTFYHSIPSRVHNVVLAASKINGTLVAPGETFSFNQVLGDVSQFTGYQQAYIISEGKTILGDGGGVCQVSTTLFRALLNAGLPITERQAHAYRVGYYEQDSSPGFDATVYSPSPDLKFVNNTQSHILIVVTANPKKYSLVFELYGTNDGRVSTISKPVVTNVTAPPDDIYQDDPTLPAGTIKQIDFKAWGAKVTFNYSVKKDGQEIYKKTFTSNYRPWQAIYLRGTATQ